MKLVALQGFSWAHAGVRIEQFEKGQLIETEDEDLIKVAFQEGWVEDAEKPQDPKKAESKSKEKKPVSPAEPPVEPAVDPAANPAVDPDPVA